MATDPDSARGVLRVEGTAGVATRGQRASVVDDDRRLAAGLDADLRRHGPSWRFHAFRGDAWTNISKPDRKRYLLNAYRVLLTRARQGMVIFVPPGETSDPTRAPAFYDETHEYLTRLGMLEI